MWWRGFVGSHGDLPRRSWALTRGWGGGRAREREGSWARPVAGPGSTARGGRYVMGWRWTMLFWMLGGCTRGAVEPGLPREFPTAWLGAPGAVFCYHYGGACGVGMSMLLRACIAARGRYEGSPCILCEQRGKTSHRRRATWACRTSSSGRSSRAGRDLSRFDPEP